LNASLPAATQPTCNKCLQDTMGVFAAATGERKRDGLGNALVNTYVAAAEQVNIKCGPQFVNASLAAPVEGLGISNFATPYSNTGILALGLVMLSWWL